MSRAVLIPFGLIFAILGVVTIAHPQRVHNLGSARRRYEDGELSEFGFWQQRGLGVFSLLLGVLFVVLGVT
jgi:hypothetical protein